MLDPQKLRRGMLAALFLVAGACGILEPEISENGVVTFVDIEGGCWVIEGEEQTYLPINLPGNLRVDGLSVQFEGEFRMDFASFCPGRPINLIFIEAAVDDDGGQ